VIPFAVLGEYKTEKSKVEDFNAQLDQQYAEFTRQGCTRAAG